MGDACDAVNDLDDDGDGVEDQADNCAAVPNANQADGDGDGVGDNCDATFNDDADGDGIVNASDNCPSVPNASQSNQDGDRFGDACDADQGNGGGTAKANRASSGPMLANAGSAVRLGDVELQNTSPFPHRVRSIELKLSNPANIARIYGTVGTVRFHCAPAQPASLNSCVADAVLELQPGEKVKVDVWVELTSVAAKLQQLSAMDMTLGGGGLMLIGTVGLGLGRRRPLRYSVLIGAALLLSACGNNGRGEDAVEGADPKLSRVTLESIEIRDSLNAPVDYGVRQDSADVGQVGAN
ncbi:MAG TPA: thrombospondin type 3 repeat-containing protein [Fontimonas sp.]